MERLMLITHVVTVIHAASTMRQYLTYEGLDSCVHRVCIFTGDEDNLLLPGTHPKMTQVGQGMGQDDPLQGYPSCAYFFVSSGLMY